MSHQVANMSVRQILDALDQMSLEGQVGLAAESSRQCRRRAWRRQFRVLCDMWILSRPDEPPKCLRVQTRNLSERGVGLLAPNHIAPGTLVELRIALAGNAPIHMAGTVAFARAAQSGLFEIGIHLRTRQAAPILYDDPMRAAVKFDWICTAFQAIGTNPAL